QAGKHRSAAFKWDDSAPRNFEKNLLVVLGLKTFDTFFDTLPEVEDIYDLYRLRTRPEVLDFIEKDKLFMSFDDFSTMMGIIDDIYKDWRCIYDILRAAGRKKHPEQTLDPPKLHEYDNDKFGTLTRQTLGQPTFPSIFTRPASLDDCYSTIQSLEAY